MSETGGQSAGIVVQTHKDYRAHSWQDSGRVFPPFDSVWPGQVAHLAVVAPRQPVGVEGEMTAGGRVGHARQVEAHPPRLFCDLIGQSHRRASHHEVAVAIGFLPVATAGLV